MSMSKVASAAALSQSLVEWLDTLYDRGDTLPVPRSWVVRENKWRAARHGVEAEIIVDDEGTLSPVTTAIGQLVEELRPTAHRLGCEDELLGGQAEKVDVMREELSGRRLEERERAAAHQCQGSEDQQRAAGEMTEHADVAVLGEQPAHHLNAAKQKHVVHDCDR